MTQRKTIVDLLNMKGKEKIVSLTAYDYQTATLFDQAEIDFLLVGDSVGNVIYGKEDTLSVTVEDIIRHTQAVTRACKQSLVVADMPFGSYQPSIELAVTNASRFLSEGGAQAVKLEGGIPMAATISRLVEVGIPVMGHVGLTPQSINQMGGYRFQGKNEKERKRVFEDARAVEKAGAFAVVLECVEEELSKIITQELRIPTIGIGSGENCDGQILVSNDLLGLNVGHIPKFVKPMANLKSIILETALAYRNQVKGIS